MSKKAGKSKAPKAHKKTTHNEGSKTVSNNPDREYERKQLVDPEGKPIYDQDGNPVYEEGVHAHNADGSPILDAEGQPYVDPQDHLLVKDVQDGFVDGAAPHNPPHQPHPSDADTLGKLGVADTEPGTRLEDAPYTTDDSRITRVTAASAAELEVPRHIPSETEAQATAGKVTGNRGTEPADPESTLGLPDGTDAYRPRKA